MRIPTNNNAIQEYIANQQQHTTNGMQHHIPMWTELVPNNLTTFNIIQQHRQQRAQTNAEGLPSAPV